MSWIKDFFNGPKYFELDKNKEYTDKDFIDILKNKIISLDTGNLIVLCLLEKIIQRLDNKSNLLPSCHNPLDTDALDPTTEKYPAPKGIEECDH